MVDEARVKRKLPELLSRSNTKEYFQIREKAMTLERNSPDAFNALLCRIIKSLDDLERKMNETEFEF